MIFKCYQNSLYSHIHAFLSFPFFFSVCSLSPFISFFSRGGKLHCITIFFYSFTIKYHSTHKYILGYYLLFLFPFLLFFFSFSLSLSLFTFPSWASVVPENPIPDVCLCLSTFCFRRFLYVVPTPTRQHSPGRVSLPLNCKCNVAKKKIKK